jgi:DNA (cytosine-5)-methyltransferase 1
MGRNGEFSIVDLFAGPGGLAEGFSQVRATDGSRPFRIGLSVEKDNAAHATLLLRTFLRQFPDGPPSEYYDFLNSGASEPDWSILYPAEWSKAESEALKLTLGDHEAWQLLETRLRKLRETYGDDTIVVGGPPCQAYSLVGRARNRGIKGYTPEGDDRHHLYQEYIRILEELRPAAFVMENVKGMLSSAVSGGKIFERILVDLRSACSEGYNLVALTPRQGSDRQGRLARAELRPSDFIIRAERHGLPQARHRVMIIGLRADLFDAECLIEEARGLLLERPEQPVEAVLDGMPRLRSGLSRSEDSFDQWRQTISDALTELSNTPLDADKGILNRFRNRIGKLQAQLESSPPLSRSSKTPNGLGRACSSELQHWISDPSLRALPNNMTRSHMPSDLGRYLFCAVYAEVAANSPKAAAFPTWLAPDHRNWNSGKFADRFRVQMRGGPATTVTSHISKDGHYFIHPDASQCRSLTVREAARLQTFPDNYYFKGNRTEQFVQVGNAVPPFLAKQIGGALLSLLTDKRFRRCLRPTPSRSIQNELINS